MHVAFSLLIGICCQHKFTILYEYYSIDVNYQIRPRTEGVLLVCSVWYFPVFKKTQHFSVA